VDFLFFLLEALAALIGENMPCDFLELLAGVLIRDVTAGEVTVRLLLVCFVLALGFLSLCPNRLTGFTATCSVLEAKEGLLIATLLAVVGTVTFGVDLLARGTGLAAIPNNAVALTPSLTLLADPRVCQLLTELCVMADSSID